MSLPPGPNLSPIARRIRVFKWIFNPFSALEERQQQYGDYFTVDQTQSTPVVYLNHPLAIQQIFSAPPDAFEVGRSNSILSVIVGENSLLLADSDRHQRQRKLLMPPFHGERMRTYGELICQIAQHVIQTWEIGQPFRVRESTQEISLRVILNAVFGLHSGERYDELRKLLTQFLEVIGSPLSSTLLFFRILQQDLGAWSPWGRFLRLRKKIDQILIAEIQRVRAEENPDRDDILTLLLQAKDETGEPMTDEEIRDELLTLLFAGHETTASALSWALYWIDTLPEVREKLQHELQTLAPDATPEELARLPYLSAVCSETLRIYPIAISPFPRVVKSPIKIMGYQFEPGTSLLISIYLIHQRPDLYPQPKKFKPERFLERQFSPYEYLPFGGGNRRCLGQAFALFEMKLVLATILSYCQLQRVNNQPLKPVRRGLTVAPPNHFKMVRTV